MGQQMGTRLKVAAWYFTIPIVWIRMQLAVSSRPASERRGSGARNWYHTQPSCYQQRYTLLGFPGGAVVKNLPANAGDMGSSPGLGRSHMPRSDWAREPQLLSLRVWSLCSATGEAVTVRGSRTAMKSGPRSPQTGESPRTETKTQHSQK